MHNVHQNVCYPNEKLLVHLFNKTGLQPVSRPVEKVPLFKGWGVGTKSLVVNAGKTDTL